MRHARQDYNRIQDPENKIPEDEPVFLLRGQDVLAPDIIREYASKTLELPGTDEQIVKSETMANLLFEFANEIEEWQRTHITKIADL